MAGLSEQEIIRREKLAKLRALGIDPYPAPLYPVDHTSADIKNTFAEGKKVVIAGRLMSRRIQGKASFAELQDSKGRIQVYFNRDEICTGEDKTLYNEVYKKLLDIGDIIGIEGTLFTTKVGEQTVQVTNFSVLNKTLRPLPLPKTDADGNVYDEFNDPELRYRQRYVDLIVNPKVKDTFIKRTKITNSIRSFFNEREYLEVETPILQPIPGGASARPFITHHNALDMEMYLRIAPELFLKRLVVGGFERVFEVNRNFRNEGISIQHNPEFTMLEFYQAYATWEELMDLTEELVRELALKVCGSTTVTYGDHDLDFGTTWRRLPFATAVAEASGLSEEDVWDADKLRARWIEMHPEDAKKDDLPKSVGKWFEYFFDAYVEPNLIQPTFLTHFPTEISPLSRRSDSDPKIADRFELFIAGREIANGFNELNDPVDQAERFSLQVAAKDAGDDEAMFFDSDYIKALSYGMPPTAGEGIGIDRLVMLLTNAQSIREVILFPTLKPRG